MRIGERAQVGCAHRVDLQGVSAAWQFLVVRGACDRAIDIRELAAVLPDPAPTFGEGGV